MNPDHTHFIIIREQPIGSSSIGKKTATTETGERQLERLTDSAESLTNKFRDRFEDFLHQEALPQSVGEQNTIGIRYIDSFKINIDFFQIRCSFDQSVDISKE